MTDFVLTDVAKSVARQKILENGYGYIVSGVDAVVAHPKVSETAKSSQTILQLEFLSGENPEEEAAYRTNILTPMRAGGTSSAVYQKRTLVHPRVPAASSLTLSSPSLSCLVAEEETWFIAYNYVPSAQYSVALTVPEDDIQAPFIRARGRIIAAMTIIVVVIAIVLCAVAACAAVFANRVAHGTCYPGALDA